jgi:hypothetical protein
MFMVCKSRFVHLVLGWDWTVCLCTARAIIGAGGAIAKGKLSLVPHSTA